VKKIILLLMCLSFPAYASAVTHYVSPNGSDTPPYDSWATAADSIQKGIDAASYGDTVMVGSGTYYEYDIAMTPGISLIGAGMDSCIIDASWVPQLTSKAVLVGADSSSVEGFHIVGNHFPPLDGSLIGVEDPYGITLRFVKENKLTHCLYGMYLRKCPQVVSNLIDSTGYGIRSFSGYPLIANNTITNCYGGISGGAFDRDARIVKNIIHSVGRGIDSNFHDSLLIANNLIYDVTGYAAIVIGHSSLTQKHYIVNNSLSSNKLNRAADCHGDSDIRNNIVFESYLAITGYGSGVVLTVEYNDLWNNTDNYQATGGAIIDTSGGGNTYLDPMFLGGDDYHLQYGSPCIDAGDPNIKDPDSSRSDMGCFGGVWGEIYTYQDYPPQAPDSLEALSLNDVTVLSWKPNTESDLSHYSVYRDTIAGFTPDEFNIVGIAPKDSSIFRDYYFVLGKTYYYRVSAWDQTGHESEYSDELEVMATSVGEYVEEETGPPMYRLFQNYPNPFNSSTVIWYFLPDVGYQPAEVEIRIYNVLGELVRTLVKKREYPGQHKVMWDGRDDDGNEVGSGVYFCRLKVSGLEMNKPRKMVLLK
jgi:hypothetical protein